MGHKYEIIVLLNRVSKLCTSEIIFQEVQCQRIKQIRNRVHMCRKSTYRKTILFLRKKSVTENLDL